MTTPKRYHSFIATSARWDGFAFRDDDVVIQTPPKSGTTWMQTLVALLLFDGVPAQPVPVLSPWLDQNLQPLDDVVAALEAQQHRRFIKTHTPFDGLPWDDDVTWLVVGRDPRDVFVSMLHHMEELDGATTAALRTAAVGDPDTEDLPREWPDTEDERELTAAFLELPPGRNTGSMQLSQVLHQLKQAWAARHRRNVHLFHFADLTRDLTAELRRLRDVLGTGQDDERVAELAGHASLDAMRGRAAATAPEAHLGAWKDPARFFRGGRTGDGVARMTEEELRRYDERCAALVDDPDLLAWVHGGRAAADPERR